MTPTAALRTLQQPGPALAPRGLLRWSGAHRDLRIRLPVGADLMDGLVAALSGAGIEQAGMVLLGGDLARVAYSTGRADETGYRVATPHGPFECEGPLTVIGGSALLGRDKTGAPLLHCHAVFADRAGRVLGGHLRPGRCPLGPAGLTASAACPGEGGFQVADDAETNFPIFQLLGPEVAP